MIQECTETDLDKVLKGEMDDITPEIPAVKGNAVDELIEGGLGSNSKIFTDNPFDEVGNLKSNVKYQTGEFKYNYETDVNGRISNWNTDNLQLTKRTERLKHNPNTPGKVAGDHSGHLAGDRFGGSPNLDNLVSQLENVNLSQYKKLKINGQMLSKIENKLL